MSETSRLLADGVDGFLGRHGAEDEARLHAGLVESGFALALGEEAHGGLGASWTEAAVVARLWGRHAACLPIVELLLAARVSGLIGRPDLTGRLTFAPDILRHGHEVVAAAYPGADLVVVAREGAPGPAVVSLDGATQARTLADEPCWRIAQVPADEPDPLGVPGELDLQRRGTVLTVARMLGAMERVVELMVEHATIRTQFGRPLAKFQLVQVLLADAASEVDATRAVLERALLLLDRAEPDPLVWYAAKSQAATAATLVSANAHQLFGAIGFTREHALQRYTRRLWAWRDAWLTQAAADETLGRQACAAGGRGLWPWLVDPRPIEGANA